MKKIFAVLLILAMLLSMVACGEKEEDPNAGMYEGVTAKALGVSMPMSDVYTGATWVELKSGGKGNMSLDGDEFGIKWSLDGNALTITIDGVDSTGTLEAGVIVIDLLGMGVEMTFLKEGAQMPEPEATYNDVGYWDIVRIDSDDPDAAVSEEDMAYVKAYDTFAYLELLEGGTGTLYLDEEFPITWQDGSFTDEEGLEWTYTLEGDELSLVIESNTFVFRKGEKPEPVVSEMEQAGFTEFMEEGVAYPYTTMCYEDEAYDTTGEVTVTNYEIFESTEGYEYKEGYEWRLVSMEAFFYDENAWDYGISVPTRVEDYYNTKLHDDTFMELDESEDFYSYSFHVIHKGQEQECYYRFTDYWSDWVDETCTYYMDWAYQVPIGYDGIVVGVKNARLEDVDGTYITDYDPADFVLFRLYNKEYSDVAAEDGIAGTYTLYAMESDGEYVDHDTIVFLELEQMIEIVLNADGTGTLAFEGEVSDCTYTDSEIIDDTGYACPYYMEDGMLVLELEEGTLCYCQKN